MGICKCRVRRPEYYGDDMIKRFDNIKLSVFKSESALINMASRKLGAPVKYFKIIKKSLDARDKANICWVYSVACSCTEEAECRQKFDLSCITPRIAIVGSGPAGLMCALRLVDHGIAPIILERGQSVELRRAACNKFFTEHTLDSDSNVQFGEGGAGTFSDGKLNTQTHDGFNRDVLEYFARFGAPEEILYLNKPHIGSDKLFDVLRAIRAHIISRGGSFMFDTRVVGIEKRGEELAGLNVVDVRTGKSSFIACDAAVLAIGHSARDTFQMLDVHGVFMEPRDFAVGVRIEHLARDINFAQYGKASSCLPAADYKLVSHAGGRTVFTFCMCPGGVVIPAASEEGGVVVNGMSLYARSGTNSNCALMVQMRRTDFGSDDLFSGMRFQRKLEERAFALGGGDYRAPAMTLGDFMSDKICGDFSDVKPSYAAGVKYAPLSQVLPSVAVEALKSAIPDMNRKLRGFASPHAVLTGVESRFSSPVRIVRGQSLESISLKNLYPCGEGSGYSGGITSSAADGIRVAERIFEKFR